MTQTVARCDLRPHQRAQEALQEVDRFLGDEARSDVRLLLVIDTPLALAEHALAYEVLWRSRRVDKLLNVLVGPLVQPGLLEVPASIGADRDSGTIWVGDPAGVDWRLSGMTVTGIHPGSTAEPGLAALLTLLSAPELFTRAVALIATVPERIVCPGLRIFETAVNQTMFLSALSRSIGWLLDADAAGTSASGGAADGTARMPAGVRSIVVPGSRLASVRERCRADATELAETAEALGSAVSLYGTDHLGARARDLAAGTGAALREYRTAVQMLVTTPVGEKAARLRDWGVQPTLEEGTEPDDIATMITSAMTAGESLPALSRRLRDHERKLRAHGDSAAAERIDRICPRELEDRFIQPEPMAGPQPWLVATGAAAVALVALGPTFGIVVGAVTALAWLALVGLTIVRAPGGQLADHRASLVGASAAAAAGLAIGIEVAQILHPPSVAGVAGIVAGLAAALAAVTWSWRTRARRWSRRLRAGDAIAAADSLTEVVTAAANREWSAAAMRQDALIRARSAIEGAAVTLRAYRDKLDEDLSRSQSGARTQQEFDAFVGRTLARLLRVALQSALSTLTSSSPQEHEERARSETRELLQRWDKHVDDGHSPLDLPDFLRADDVRDGARRNDRGLGNQDAMGYEDIAAIRETITTEPWGIMWQLCRAHDIGLLDPLTDQVAVLRFAPRAVQPALGGILPAQIEWLGSATRAGVLRLVPLRRGVVRRTWPAAEDPAAEDHIHDLPVGSRQMDGRAQT